MLRNRTRAFAGLATAALLIPGAALAKPGHGHGNPHGGPAIDAPTAVTPPASDQGKHLAKGHAKPHKLVLKGTVVSVGAAPTTSTDTTPTATAADTTATDATPAATTVTIHVTHANNHGRALVGQDVTFTIPAGGVRAADANGDGKVDLADVKVGDKVLVQTVKVAADATQPLAARKLIDQSSRENESEDSDPEDAPAPAPAPTT